MFAVKALPATLRSSTLVSAAINFADKIPTKVEEIIFGISLTTVEMVFGISSTAVDKVCGKASMVFPTL